ncbi:hypothetical protein D3C81_2007860 [compost metagenome]
MLKLLQRTHGGIGKSPFISAEYKHDFMIYLNHFTEDARKHKLLGEAVQNRADGMVNLFFPFGQFTNVIQLQNSHIQSGAFQ